MSLKRGWRGLFWELGDVHEGGCRVLAERGRDWTVEMLRVWMEKRRGWTKKRRVSRQDGERATHWGNIATCTNPTTTTTTSIHPSIHPLLLLLDIATTATTTSLPPPPLLLPPPPPPPSHHPTTSAHPPPTRTFSCRSHFRSPVRLPALIRLILPDRDTRSLPAAISRFPTSPTPTPPLPPQHTPPPAPSNSVSTPSSHHTYIHIRKISRTSRLARVLARLTAHCFSPLPAD